MISKVTLLKMKHKFIIVSIAMVFSIYLISLVISPYFYWDDEWMVLTNPYLTKYDLGSLFEVVFTSFQGQYSPVNSLMYIAIIALFGFNPLIFHLVCLTIHIFNMFLVYRFIAKLVSIKYHEKYTELQVLMISALVALLFGISPLQIEAVSWISASKILLFSFFFLLSCIYFLKFTRNFSKYQYWLSLMFFILAIGSKEQAVVLPIILTIIVLYIKANRKYYIWIIPFFIISIVSGILTLSVQEDGFSKTLANDYYPIHQRIILSCYTVTQYVVKVLLPIRQWMFYKFPMNPGEPLPVLYNLYPIIDLVLIYFFYLLFWTKKYNYFIFGLAFFLINIFLTLHIVPLGRQSLMADRYVYLPIIGVYFPLCIFVIDQLSKAIYKRSQYLIVTGIILYVGLTYVKSIHYIFLWSNYWLETIVF